MKLNRLISILLSFIIPLFAGCSSVPVQLSTKTFDKSITITPVQEARTVRMGIPWEWAMVPLVPFILDEYENPIYDKDFDKNESGSFTWFKFINYLLPNELNNTINLSMKRSKIFNHVNKSYSYECLYSDYLLESQLLSTRKDMLQTLYGLSLAAIPIALLGVPGGNSDLNLTLQFTLIDNHSGKKVWEKKFNKSKGFTEGFYYGSHGKNLEEYKAYYKKLIVEIMEEAIPKIRYAVKKDIEGQKKMSKSIKKYFILFTFLCSLFSGCSSIPKKTAKISEDKIVTITPIHESRKYNFNGNSTWWLMIPLFPYRSYTGENPLYYEKADSSNNEGKVKFRKYKYYLLPNVLNKKIYSAVKDSKIFDKTLKSYTNNFIKTKYTFEAEILSTKNTLSETLYGLSIGALPLALLGLPIELRTIYLAINFRLLNNKANKIIFDKKIGKEMSFIGGFYYGLDKDIILKTEVEKYYDDLSNEIMEEAIPEIRSAVEKDMVKTYE
jgi:uncharacterized protein YceK